MKLTETENTFFIRQVSELLQYEHVHRMKGYLQHGNTTTLSHCIVVAYYSYRLSLRLPLPMDAKSIIRGSMLHDFYLYDWHIPDKSHKLHGFLHPKFALTNARKYFHLNAIEEDIIAKHMWPLTFLTVPKNKEAMLVCLVDKYISSAETLYIPILSKELKRIHRILTNIEPKHIEIV